MRVATHTRKARCVCSRNEARHTAGGRRGKALGTAERRFGEIIAPAHHGRYGQEDQRGQGIAFGAVDPWVDQVGKVVHGVHRCGVWPQALIPQVGDQVPTPTIDQQVTADLDAIALGDSQAKTRTHYIRDAQGNVMAVYQYDRGTNSLKLTERPLYGSDRLGMDARPVQLYGLTDLGLRNTSPVPTGDGELRYELKDHLGNVAATLYGVVYGVDLNSDGQLDRFYPKVLGSQGYEAFGSLLPGRNYNSGSTRYGFNGKENDNEVHGAVGTFQDYGFRMYDTRIARFISVDPLAAKFPMLTPYQFASNNPIRLIDIDGLEGGEPPRNDGNTVLTTEVSGGVINRFYTTTTTTPDFTYKMGETIRTRREERVGTVNPDGTFTFELQVNFGAKSTRMLNPAQVTEQIRAIEGDIERLGGASSIKIVGYTKGAWADENDPNPELGRETWRQPMGNDGRQRGSIGQNDVSRNIETESSDHAVTWGSWLDLGKYRAEAVKGMLSQGNQANTMTEPNRDANNTDDRRATLVVTPTAP